VTSLTVSVEEAAVMLGCSAEHVRRQIRRGVLPKVEGIGRKVKISREVIFRAISGEAVGPR
jgi:excisionase family DNA binding protein